MTYTQHPNDKNMPKCAEGLSENDTQKCQKKRGQIHHFFVFSQNTIILGTNNDSDFSPSATYTSG